MTEAPIIGVTTGRVGGSSGQTHQYAAPQSYLAALAAAGGIPLLIPSSLQEDELGRIFERLDGLLLIGGGDIDPQRFNGRSHPRVYGVDAERDAVELALVRMAVEQKRPFLGICRGIQVINVAFGGSLFTDIADQMKGAHKHDYFPDYPRNQLVHAVAVQSGSRVALVLGGVNFQVNSLHHQGLERVGEGLTAAAWAEDGLVEAVELDDHPFGIGVQWHPEWLQEHPPQRALFRGLVEAAGSEQRFPGR